MPDSPVRLIHWNAAEAGERAARLRAAGLEVSPCVPSGQEAMRELIANPPPAILICLDRLPSHGREIAMSLRTRKATRAVPLVFVGGESEKVARIRDLLPDAVFTTFDRIPQAVRKAIRNAPASPVRPSSVLAAYSGTSLVRKLGIKTGFTVALLGAPPEFLDTLGDLPDGVSFRNRPSENCHLTLWFVRSRAELERELEWMALSNSPLWILWPKQSSRLAADLTQPAIRAAAATFGLVDYRICAVDAVWSGLLFRCKK